jgi:hypothetical protein
MIPPEMAGIEERLRSEMGKPAADLSPDSGHF